MFIILIIDLLKGATVFRVEGVKTELCVDSPQYKTNENIIYQYCFKLDLDTRLEVIQDGHYNRGLHNSSKILTKIMAT